MTDNYLQYIYMYKCRFVAVVGSFPIIVFQILCILKFIPDDVTYPV